MAKGRFIPRHPEKYLGDVDKIFFRSSWELNVMKWLDNRNAVLRWSSEEISIPYLSPADNRVHQYFPDFYMEYVSSDGTLLKEIVEIKPRHETEMKYAKHDRSKEAVIVNEAKWRAAITWCEGRNFGFRVLTEATLFHKPPKVKKKK